MNVDKIAEALNTLAENGHFIISLVTIDDVEHEAKERGIDVKRHEIETAIKKILKHWDDSHDIKDALDWSLEAIALNRSKQAKIAEVSF